MRILFAGSPAIAVPSLEMLCKNELCGFELAGVLTNPDTPKGRRGTPQPTEVGEAAAEILARFAEQASIAERGKNVFPILKPEKLDAAAREQVLALKPDLLVSFAYGKLFGPKFLSLFRLGGINIHPSLLPKYRGAAPIQAAIKNGDSETGITIQTLAREMDCGDILAQEKLRLTGRETTGSLSETAAFKAAEMLPAVLKKIADGTVRPVPQNHSEATYCSLLTRDEGIIDWNKSAAEIDAKIRSFTPWPLCRSFHNGRELYILKAGVYAGDSAEKTGEDKTLSNETRKGGFVLGYDKNEGILIQTGDGVLAVTELQYQAKKALPWKDFLNGARDFLHTELK